MRRITLNIFTSDLKEREPYVFTCPKGHQFSPAGVADLIARFMGHVEEKFPEHIWRVVPVGKGRYNVLPEPKGNA